MVLIELMRQSPNNTAAMCFVIFVFLFMVIGGNDMMNEIEKLRSISPRIFMGSVANVEELPKTVGEFKDKWGSYPIQWDMAIVIEPDKEEEDSDKE